MEGEQHSSQSNKPSNYSSTILTGLPPWYFIFSPVTVATSYFNVALVVFITQCYCWFEHSKCQTFSTTLVRRLSCGRPNLADANISKLKTAVPITTKNKLGQPRSSALNGLVFTPFPKPKTNLVKWKDWIKLCSRYHSHLKLNGGRLSAV